MPLLVRGQKQELGARRLRKQSRWLPVKLGWNSAGIIARASFPAGNSSAWRWRALITDPKLAGGRAHPATWTDSGSGFPALIARPSRASAASSSACSLAFARRCHRVLRLRRGRMEEIAPGLYRRSFEDSRPGKIFVVGLGSARQLRRPAIN